MKTGRYSLKDLLTHNEIEQIIIPEIQRDYVWKSDNVNKLLESIIHNFKKKEKTTLEIKAQGETINQASVVEYLQQEYQKLKYNLKIGFIYAYHDRDFAGKFFLIDGQQRMTTLYLLLLAVYCRLADKKDEFKTLYFNSEKLKVDYKVREASHDFLLEFVKNQLLDNNKHIRDSVRYYKSEYDKDETVRNILINYDTISQFLNQIDELNDFLDYIENYVELNYFDTHLSEQGESLYIYMNSRGESLSYQEIIRAEIINTQSSDVQKKVVGRKWEDWQNFFWSKKLENENADKGFEEFLKWASIIHICNQENPEIIRTKPEQSLREAKENYIHQNPQRTKEQKELLFKYQTSQLKADSIETVFKGLMDIYKWADELNLNLNWLSDKISVIDYIQLLPLIFLAENGKWESEIQKILDLKRLSYFLFNLKYFESVKKNPDNYTIVALELVKNLCDSSKTDIISFLEYDKFKGVLTDSEKYKLVEYSKPNSLRADLEEFVWKVTLDKDLSSFLEGNINVLFECLNDEIKYDTVNGVYTEFDIQLLNDYYIIFKEGIYMFRNDDILRRAMLTVGNYLYYENSESWHFGNKIERYTFLNDDEEWRKLLYGYRPKNEQDELIIIKFLKALKLQKGNHQFDYKQYYRNLREQFKLKDWREPFIKKSFVLKYCGKKKVLWENPTRIILLDSVKASKAAEIQCVLVKAHFEKWKMWIYEHNCCVLNFNYENGNLIPKDKCYAIDITYVNKNWSFNLFHRDEKLSSEKLSIFLENGWIKTENGRVTKSSNMIYSDDDLEYSILENVNLVCEQIEILIVEVKNILIKQNTI
ncbi:MAG: DUF262 domain-containing protein [Bacteroidales bacterium]